MNHVEIRAARLKLGLTQKNMAKMLEIDERNYRKFEADPAKRSTAKTPNARIIRLLQSYLSGYRTEDWPKK